MLTGKEILELKLEDGNDAKAETVREYLKAILNALWYEVEGFSGKRPLGNSDWTSQLMDPLEQYATEEQSADQMIYDAIDAL